jgi:hypothetical protein
MGARDSVGLDPCIPFLAANHASLEILAAVAHPFCVTMSAGRTVGLRCFNIVLVMPGQLTVSNSYCETSRIRTACIPPSVGSSLECRVYGVVQAKVLVGCMYRFRFGAFGRNQDLE